MSATQFPLSDIDRPHFMNKLASAVHLILRPGPRINIPVRVGEDSKVSRLAVSPLAFKRGAVRPGHLALTVSEPIYPFTKIGAAVLVSVEGFSFRYGCRVKKLIWLQSLSGFLLLEVLLLWLVRYSFPESLDRHYHPDE